MEILTILLIALILIWVGIGYLIDDYYSKLKYAKLFISSRYDIVMELLSDEVQKKLEHKFFNFIDEKRKSEQVYLKVFDDIDALNKHRNGGLASTDDTDRAIGLYEYYKPEYDTPAKRVLNQMPKICLCNDNVWVYAHELGHHFAIKLEQDTSEERADSFIKTFAEECFTPLEFFAMHCGISAFSHCKLDTDHIIDEYAKQKDAETYKEKVNKIDKTFLFGLPCIIKKLVS